jgi:hypothetical protein
MYLASPLKNRAMHAVNQLSANYSVRSVPDVMPAGTMVEIVTFVGLENP